LETTLPSADYIRDAATLIKPYIHKTPVLTSAQINSMSGSELFFKCENLQKAGAFKSRGAMHAVLRLSTTEREKGVAAHSSGNHAQALARAALITGTRSWIVMPKTAPEVKVNGVKNYKGNIIFCEPTLQAREQTLDEVIVQTAATVIHPYNNIQVIAGQATAALELFEQSPPLDMVLCPVGGGGLLSGTLLSRNYFSPNTTIIACEPEGANDAWQSFRAGKLIHSVNPDTIADGLLTSLGSITFPIILKYVNDIVTVSDAAIIRAMKLIWERMKIVIEPSAAVCLAAILDNKLDVTGKRVGIILSGGNVDLNKLPW
jgi:threonine dehydratase